MLNQDVTTICKLNVIIVIASILPDVASGGGGKGWSCPDWGRWINASHPGLRQDEFEQPPNRSDLNQLCPPYKGVLVIQCTSDPNRDLTFAGQQWSDDYEVTCNLTHGLVCMWYNGGCPDHAIQYGCDCDQLPTSPPTTPASVVCPTQSGSGNPITAPPTGNNCSCPAAGRQRDNGAAIGPGSIYTVVLASLILNLGLLVAASSI